MKVILSVPDEGYSECTWWRLFQKHVVCTLLNIYIVIKHKIEIDQNTIQCLYFCRQVINVVFKSWEFEKRVWKLLLCTTYIFAFVDKQTDQNLT
jgi:hypothetical protein